MPTRFSVNEVNWQDAAGELSLVREKVFIAEQRVPKRIELDGRDCECLHVLARLEDDTIIGTGRMLPNGHIGHIAVLLPYRGLGVGKAVLEKLLDVARAHHQSMVYLDCELEAVPFYESQQFLPEGRVFMEAGVPHQRMVRGLSPASHFAAPQFVGKPARLG